MISRRRRLIGLLVAAVSAVSVATVSHAEPGSTSSARPKVVREFHLVAVGDMAAPGGRQAQVASRAQALQPERLLALGDLAYNSGTASEFATLYDPTYGAMKDITWPVPGNHEYITVNAQGFRDYFGVTGRTWWSHRAGAWTIIGLDSEQVDNERQITFLNRKLVENDGRPTIVAFHRPRYSTGEHGDAPDVWKILYPAKTDADVKIVLWGHDHDYERMSIPVEGRVANLQGFVVGTGGVPQRAFTDPASSMTRKRFSTYYGVLDLRLRPHSWRWSFVDVDGVVRDSGRRRF